MNRSPGPECVVVEPATADHLTGIASLAAIIWRAHYAGIITPGQIDYMLGRMYDVEVMRREIGSGIAYDQLLVNGKLRGFSSYGPTGDRGELKLHKLYVHPDSQRKGFGSLLLDRVAALARQRAFTTLVLAVNKRNDTAIAAYRKNGFRVRESVVVEIGGDFVMDDYVMVKAL